MDGFHLDNSVLEARGLLQVKGSAETFDQQDLQHWLLPLSTGLRNIFPRLTEVKTRLLKLAVKYRKPAHLGV